MFLEHVERISTLQNLPISVTCAGPYPNAAAVSAPARPLRAEALESDDKRKLLCAAVADDARKVGALNADICCMPCMSMIGFHDGVEKALGRTIFRLSTALAERYALIDKVGIIHMRPAKKRIEEIFGAKAVTPNEAQATALLAAESAIKEAGKTDVLEAVMKSIVETWRDQGLQHVLFARADAPKAEKGVAGRVSGISIDSYFRILADAILRPIPKP